MTWLTLLCNGITIISIWSAWDALVTEIVIGRSDLVVAWNSVSICWPCSLTSWLVTCYKNNNNTITLTVSCVGCVVRKCACWSFSNSHTDAKIPWAWTWQSIVYQSSWSCITCTVSIHYIWSNITTFLTFNSYCQWCIICQVLAVSSNYQKVMLLMLISRYKTR